MKIREMLSVYINGFVGFFGKTESPINRHMSSLRENKS